MYKPDSIVGAKDLEELKSILQRQLDRIGLESNLLQPGIGMLLFVQHVALTKPRDGLVVFADGTNWNPGAGAGIYAYHSGVWNKLG